ncbi:discoidin domain-containing protein [Paenibacillus sp. HWE-109]|uniref:discoidin domain-containing protein n=1 Tax=Paenibacillus sp. HWE-109 TaxID=1306526 RepID=UPI001EE13A48|nr:discoidin domain-containing protein [Paenibacillus sp. HWE-109]UKS27834.1 discoidin domain-containing protein [Paenibacillus sp. HWE-109]
MRKSKMFLHFILCLAIISSNYLVLLPDATRVSAAANNGNLALGKTVIASSSLSQHQPSYLVDGSMDTMWSTSDTGWQTSPITDEWAVVDLGGNYDIARWVVKHAASGALMTSDFQLEYSANPQGPWQTADTVTGNTYKVTDRILTQTVQTRYVRLHVTKKTSDGVDWPAVRVGEFELYGAEVIVPELTAVPGSGTVAKGTKVVLSSSLATATIYYTTDGSDPTSSASRQLYTEPIGIDQDMALKAVALDTVKGGASQIQIMTYKLAKTTVAGNLTLGKSVIVSSSLAQHQPSYLVDGSMDTMWSTSDTGWRTSPITDEWAVVDLGDRMDIARWIVQHAATNELATKDFQLEYSSGNGGGPWQTADAVVGNIAKVTDRVLPQVINTRYVRLHVTKKAAEGSDWPAVRIGEFELYAEAAMIPPIAASPGSGIILKGRTVTLSSTLSTASIYYTIDGTDPTSSTSRIRYHEALAIERNISLRAVAIDEVGGGVGVPQTFTYQLPVDDLSQYANLALGAAATMTVEAGWGNVAGRAIDGDSTTYAQPEKSGLWDLILDLRKKQPVNYAILRKNPNHQNYLTKYTIDTSDDGQNWTSVVTESNHTDLEDQVHPFPVTNARFVRLHQLATVGSPAAVWEFNLFNTSTALPVNTDLLPAIVSEGTTTGLLSSESAAKIYYTTDGSDPKTSGSSRLYAGRIPLTGTSVDSTVTVKAYAKVDGKTDSDVTSFAYQVIALTANPPAGILNEKTDVALSSSISGTAIYYTTDGSDPKSSGTKQMYVKPIAITQDTAIRAYAVKAAQESAAITFAYTMVGSNEINAALGKMAKASTEEPDHLAASAVDGKLETAWAAKDTGKGNWLQVDLGQDYELTGTEVTWKDSGKSYTYKIEVSSDAMNWYPAVDKTNQTERSQVNTDRFLDAARRYVRITVTDFELGSKAGIAEFKVFGYASDAMPVVPVGPETNGWPRPVIAPLPAAVSGVQHPVINLSGIWKFTQTPVPGFWKNSAEPSGWSDAKVPANLEVLGFDIRGKQGGDWFPDRNIENVYKTSVSIPPDYQGKKVVLRFEAAFDFARVWVNGHLVRTHRGGFTTFDCDITDYVKPGEAAWVTVGITAEKNFVEYQHVRGLVGEVKLLALPHDYLTRLQAVTSFDATYTDATLKLTAGMMLANTETGTAGTASSVVEFSLVDPDGRPIAIDPGYMQLTAQDSEKTILIPVKNPLKWDAEHPNLYKLTASVKVKGETVQTVIRKIGFREIKVTGNKMLVNGKEVKLHGVNWHQSSPFVGVAVDPQHDLASLAKLKDGNINYIRTSHWPQYEYVLDYADEIGLYVEQENSVMFINDARLNDAAYLSYFIGQFSETIEKDRSHPSIVIWSLENESGWGSNIAAIHDYVKKIDPTRPVKSSFGFNAPSSYNDLFSVHYVGNGQKIGGRDKPEIDDEYAHLYVYYEDWFNNDPAFEDFYGEAIKRYWDEMYASEGALGGAIWHSRDLNTYCKDEICGFRVKWGILDSWNREKPEYWNVKKAYSPIRINVNSLPNPGAGNVMAIPLENRYNHTNLNEIKVEWSLGDQTETITGPSVEPMHAGELVLPAKGWKLGDVVHLKFYQSDRYQSSRLVDEYNLTIGEKTFHFAEPQGKAPDIKKDDTQVTLSGQNFKLIFDKATGMITEGTYKGEKILTGGPYLTMGFTSKLDPWKLNSFASSSTDSEAIINIAGSYGGTGVTFTLHVDGTGLISTTYTVTNLPSVYDAVGVAFDVSANADRMTWDRSGLWTYYPVEQIGRNAGTAFKSKLAGDDRYGIEPTWAWSQDEKDYHKYGKDDIGKRGTSDFVASKNNYNYASLLIGETGKRLTAEGDGNGSVKSSVNADGSVRFQVNNIWSHPAAFPGWVEANSISKPITLASTYTNTVNVRLADEDRFTVSYSDVPTYASDMNWVSATTGWGSVRKDSSVQDNVLTLFDGMGSKSYTKGIGTHAYSEIVYDIANKGFEKFEAVVGVDQESTEGKVGFQVWADGQQLFDSDKMGIRTAAKKVSVNIAAKRELKLIVTDGGNGNSSDHADWADAKFIKSAAVIIPSSDATLRSIEVNGQKVPSFDKNKFEYQVVLPAGTKAIPLVTASTTDAKAELTVNQATALPGTASVEARAEDGKSVKIYQVKFTVESIPAGSGDGYSGDSGSERSAAKGKPIVKVLEVKDGNAIVNIDSGVTELLIPLEDKSLHDMTKLIIRNEDLSLEIPSAVMMEWAGLIKDLNPVYVSFKLSKIEKSEAERLLNVAAHQAAAKIALVGPVYELSLQISDRDGTKLRTLSSFAQPLVLKLKAGEMANKELTGIYFFKDNGGLEFAGGSEHNGMVEASIQHFSIYGVLMYDKTFTDVPPSHWAASVIQRMAAQGIITGVSDKEFAPQNKVTRAEFVAMLTRALGLKATTGPTTFRDVNESDPYASAIVAAYQAGVVKGRSETLFAPKDTITREEMAIMIIRAYEVKTGKKAPALPMQSQYADDDQISDWAKKAVYAASNLDLLRGRGENEYVPHGVTTRAESTQVIANLMGK